MDTHDHSFCEWKQNISDFLSLSYERKGYSPLVGKIFTQLLFATEPLSLQDLVEETGVTKAAVSIQIRHMERLGMCRKMPSSNDRRDYYYMSETYILKHAQRIIYDLEMFQTWADKTVNEISSVATSDPVQQNELLRFRQRFSPIAAMYNKLLPVIKEVEEEFRKRAADSRKNIENHT